VVSLPSWHLFGAQDAAYRASVLPRDTVTVSIEAGATGGWQRWLGAEGVAIGIDHFGASAPYDQLYRAFGVTAEAVVDAALRLRGRA
jgi:transketolase